MTSTARDKDRKEELKGISDATVSERDEELKGISDAKSSS